MRGHRRLLKRNIGVPELFVFLSKAHTKNSYNVNEFDRIVPLPL